MADVLVRFLRWPEVQRRVGVSRSTVWRLTRRGLFPRPVLIGLQAKGWRSDEIDTWVESRQPRDGGDGATNHEAMVG